MTEARAFWTIAPGHGEIRGETLPPEQLATCLAYILAATNRVRGMADNLLDASVQQSGHTLTLLLARTDLVARATGSG